MNDMTFEIELNEDTGKVVVRWKVGEFGGYCATIEDAANDASKFDADPVPHPERKQLSGCQQYRSTVTIHGKRSSEFSDWYPTNAAAAVGFWRVMEEQGYKVLSINIALPVSSVTVE